MIFNIYSFNTIFTIIIGFTSAIFVKFLFFNKKNDNKNHEKRKSFPKDKVILHQVERGLRAPSASPFCLKLETW